MDRPDCIPPLEEGGVLVAQRQRLAMRRVVSRRVWVGEGWLASDPVLVPVNETGQYVSGWTVDCVTVG